MIKLLVILFIIKLYAEIFLQVNLDFEDLLFLCITVPANGRNYYRKTEL